MRIFEQYYDLMRQGAYSDAEAYLMNNLGYSKQQAEQVVAESFKPLGITKVPVKYQKYLDLAAPLREVPDGQAFSTY